MANVPRVTRRVFTEALPDVRRTAAETEASAGVGIAEAKARQGAALAGFGRTLGEVGAVVHDIALKEREKADETALMEFDNQVSQWEAQTVYDPQNGALAKRGKDAMGMPEAVLGDFKKQTDALVGTLQPGRQQEAAQKLLLRRQANLEMTLRRHTFSEMQRYQVGELEAFVTNRANSAIVNGGTVINGKVDARRAEEDIAAAVAALKSQGPRLGIQGEQLEQQVTAVKSQAYSGIIDRLLSQDQVAAAKAYFTEVRDDIKGEALTRIEKALEVGTIREQSQDQTEQILAAHPGDLAAQRAAAKQIEDRKVRDETLARLEHEWAVKERQENDEHQAWMLEARKVLDTTGDWRTLETQPYWSRLSIGEVASLRSYATMRVKKIPVETQPARWYELVQQATSDNPAVRARFFDPKQTNLLEDIDKLSESDWQQLAQLQATGAAQMAKEQRALLINAAAQNKMVDEAIRGMGLDPTPKEPGAKDYNQAAVDRVNTFRRSVREAVAALEHQQQKPATDDQVQKVVDQLRKPIGSKQVVVRFGRDRYETKFKFEVDDVKEIPGETRQQIFDAMRRWNMPVTSQGVLSLYRMFIGRAFAEPAPSVPNQKR